MHAPLTPISFSPPSPPLRTPDSLPRLCRVQTPSLLLPPSCTTARPCSLPPLPLAYRHCAALLQLGAHFMLRLEVGRLHAAKVLFSALSDDLEMGRLRVAKVLLSVDMSGPRKRAQRRTALRLLWRRIARKRAQRRRVLWRWRTAKWRRAQRRTARILSIAVVSAAVFAQTACPATFPEDARSVPRFASQLCHVLL